MNKLVSIALQDYVAEKRSEMPEELQALRLAALWDLWHGPSPITPEWPGLKYVLVLLEKWMEEHLVDDLWVNMETEEVLTTEPESTEEDPVDWSEWRKLDSQEVRREVMGNEIAKLIWG